MDSYEMPSPSEQDILVSRLVARIAELEEKLYAKELDAPVLPSNNLMLCNMHSCLFLHLLTTILRPSRSQRFSSSGH